MRFNDKEYKFDKNLDLDYCINIHFLCNIFLTFKMYIYKIYLYDFQCFL